jgi:hypothetical protein
LEGDRVGIRARCFWLGEKKVGESRKTNRRF